MEVIEPRIREGVLRYLACKSHGQIFRTNYSEIVAMLRKEYLDPKNFGLENPKDFPKFGETLNPYFVRCGKETRDDELARMVSEGLLEVSERYAGRGVTHDYSITIKGAKSIKDTALVAAIEALGKNTSAPDDVVSMTRVEAVLGSVIGKNSPLTKQILAQLNPPRRDTSR